jgi:hypothetical protein
MALAAAAPRAFLWLDRLLSEAETVGSRPIHFPPETRRSIRPVGAGRRAA